MTNLNFHTTLTPFGDVLHYGDGHRSLGIGVDITNRARVAEMADLLKAWWTAFNGAPS